jgi:F420-dependent methylenetetrahydromethanopterin dehydrogenase
MNYDKAEARSNANIDISNNMMDPSISEGFSHSQHKSYQPIHSSSHQALIYESKYLIAEAKKLMSNRKVTYSP